VSKYIQKPLSAGSKTNDPKIIIVHAMAEYLETKNGLRHASDFLEDIGLSAHALVKPDGGIIICRDEDQGAYHARGFNKDSLGIEFLVHGAHTYESFLKAIKTDYVTPEQYASGAELVNSWLDMFDINKIVGHNDISPERKVDPGDGFNWELFLDKIKTHEELS